MEKQRRGEVILVEALGEYKLAFNTKRVMKNAEREIVNFLESWVRGNSGGLIGIAI